MQENVTPLRKRLAPAVPLTLNLEDDDGGKFSRSFKLCFDFGAGVAIRDKTGLNLRDFAIWKESERPDVLSVMLWAAILRHQPEYDSEEGLEVIESYLDDGNFDQVSEALWQAYLKYVSKEKREFLTKMREKVEQNLRRGEAASPLAQSGSEAEKESDSPTTTSGQSAVTTSASPTTTSTA